MVVLNVVVNLLISQSRKNDRLDFGERLHGKDGALAVVLFVWTDQGFYRLKIPSNGTYLKLRSHFLKCTTISLIIQKQSFGSGLCVESQIRFKLPKKMPSALFVFYFYGFHDTVGLEGGVAEFTTMSKRT